MGNNSNGKRPTGDDSSKTGAAKKAHHSALERQLLRQADAGRIVSGEGAGEQVEERESPAPTEVSGCLVDYSDGEEDEESYGTSTSLTSEAGPFPQLAITSFAVMMEAYKGVPKGCSDLSHAATFLAPRTLILDGSQERFSFYNLECVAGRSRFPVNSLLIRPGYSKPLTIYDGLTGVMTAPTFNSILTFAGVSSTLCDLSLGADFNQPISLPLTLKSITFGMSFNQPIVLPPRLEDLCFNYLLGVFNQQLTFPQGLKRLILSSRYSWPLIKLPHTLRELHMGKSSVQPVVFPLMLKKLVLPSRCRFGLPQAFPDHLTELNLGGYTPIAVLPAGLEILTVGCLCSNLLELTPAIKTLVWYSSQSVRLPEGVKKVTFGDGFQAQVHLPSGLQELVFKGAYDLPLVLPASLKSIRFVSSEHLYRLPLVLPQGCVRHDKCLR